MTRTPEQEYHLSIVRAIIAIARAIIKRHLPGVKLYRVEEGER